MKQQVILLLLTLSAALPGYTQARTPAKKHKPLLTLVEAYSQATIPGRRGAHPITATHFIVVWHGAKYPESFYWRADSGAVSCTVVKAHKIAAKQKNLPQGVDYTTENVSAGMIHTGDTLQLTPVPRGTAALPHGLPRKEQNVLLFKTTDSGWQSYPIKTITPKRAITMP